MKSKHEQLYVAVQDLLIELGITPEELRFIAASNYQIEMDKVKITAETAQKLIDADIIVETVNWRQKPVVESEKLIVSDRNNEISEVDISVPEETIFNKIKSSLTPGILWEYLQ